MQRWPTARRQGGRQVKGFARTAHAQGGTVLPACVACILKGLQAARRSQPTHPARWRCACRLQAIAAAAV